MLEVIESKLPLALWAEQPQDALASTQGHGDEALNTVTRSSFPPLAVAQTLTAS